MSEEKRPAVSNLTLEEVASLVLSLIIFVSDDNEDVKNLIIAMAESIKAGLADNEEG